MTPAPNRKNEKKKVSKASPMAAKKTIGEFTEDEARKLLEKKEREKKEAFLAEYKELCQKHGYEIGALPLPPIQFVVLPVDRN